MKFALRISVFVLALGYGTSGSAAKFQTTNFEVTAKTLPIAREIAVAAEKYRTALSRIWLGRTPEAWNFCCRIRVNAEETGGTGWTTYELLGGKVTHVSIRLDGSPDRLLEYVLPHELSHAILVLELRRPMPRWADEGAAMLSESDSQKIRQDLLVRQLLASGKLMPFRKMFQLAEYPEEKDRMYAFYAQSFALCEYLIAQGGRGRFLQFVQEGHSGEWDAAIHRHYQLKDCEALQAAWTKWVQLKQVARNSNEPDSLFAAD